jgi:hypothetical protein
MEKSQIEKKRNRQQTEKSQEHNALDRRKFMQMLAVTGLSAGVTSIIENKTDLIKNFLHNKNTAVPQESSGGKENFSNEEIKPEEDFNEKNKERQEKFKHPLSEKILEVYHSLPEDYFPKDLFSKDLLIAQQIQESGYNSQAHSHANAVGVMQNREISLKDVFRYASYLNRKGVIDYNGPADQEISEDDYEEIMKSLKKNPDYSRAFGKIYLSQLFKQYKIGQDDYKSGNTKEAQKMILAAYNAGPTKIRRLDKQENKWPKEARDYYRKIFNYEEELSQVRKILKEEKIELDPSIEDYFVKELTLKIHSVKSKFSQRSIMLKYLKKLKANYKNNKKIAHKEIGEIFA